MKLPHASTSRAVKWGSIEVEPQNMEYAFKASWLTRRVQRTESVTHFTSSLYPVIEHHIKRERKIKLYINLCLGTWENFIQSYESAWFIIYNYIWKSLHINNIYWTMQYNSMTLMYKSYTNTATLFANISI